MNNKQRINHIRSNSKTQLVKIKKASLWRICVGRLLELKEKY
ncbi:hypothetical protein NRI_0230 [Neorickettsia risticii str. Illinois]|uniref:Uncharacterized protein n=1 Tax=Neorickettsia risticii (strain Illinois) TaxID=434131 RepID=C6V4A5_NEORI|nr:hypothetical protein NRI_0230 [Neorickettsia risticii str. Illinois]